MFNGLILNPAYAGTRNGLSLTTVGRYQWVDIEGAPRTVSLSGHTTIRDKMGVGLYGEFDKYGANQAIKVFASYAYHLGLTENLKLSLGLQGGITSFQTDYSLINSENLDPVFSTDHSEILPNFGAGLYLFHEKYYLGFSIPKLLTNKLGSPTKEAKEFRHYLLSGGLILPITDHLKLRPSFLIKSVPSYAPIEADINLGLIIRDVFFIGATYRTQDSADILAQIHLNNGFRLGYAYDYTLTVLQAYNKGTHEIMLGYDFGGKDSRKPARFVTPRYF